MILCVGCGFVGGTVADSLEANGHEIIRIDPKLNGNKISDFLEFASGAVVAVPTPTVDGQCDESYIVQVLEELGTEIPVMLKSTVPPNMLAKYSDNVTYNPEFLRQLTAKEDWDNQKHFILGGTQEGMKYWADVFDFIDAEFIYTERETACMVKYMHNCWLAIKVAYFHEIFSLMQGYNHEGMVDILSKFENIGPSHMRASNDDGGLGFGGACFPKDTKAFFDYTGSQILKQVIETNDFLLEKNVQKM